MNTYYFKKAIFLIAILISFHSSFSQESEDYVPDELLIRLENGVDAAQFSANYSTLIQPKRVLSSRLNIWLFGYLETGDRDNNMNLLRADQDVKYVQNNHYVEDRSITPNDPKYSTQWAPGNINLPDAWDDYTTGGTTVQGDEIVIAIIDGKFDLDHEDLNFWKNVNEIDGNGIDDDNNGYIDDYEGWDAENSNGDVRTSKPQVIEHGTMVAGVAGAKGNNNKGISGVNWDVSIMPIEKGSTEASVVEAYSYVLDMRVLYNSTNGASGAFVVVTNSSFGKNKGNPANYPLWCDMYNSLGEEGVLSCGAAPNRDWDVDVVGDIPTTCSSDFLIAVTNTKRNNEKFSSASATNGAGFGDVNIDIGAPGIDIQSTKSNNRYGSGGGTSYSTPQVAGVISLMYAAACDELIQAYKDDPEEIALLMRGFLLDGAETFSFLNGYIDGARRLDALGALDAMFNIETLDVAPTSATNNTISGTAVFQSDIINYGAAPWQAEIVAGADVTMKAAHSITIKNALIQNGASYLGYISSSFAKCNLPPLRKKSGLSQLDHELTNNINLNVYPNPTEGQFNVATTGETNWNGDYIQVNVYAISGQLMYQNQIERIGDNVISVDISDLPKGVYLLEVNPLNGGTIQKSKIIKY